MNRRINRQTELRWLIRATAVPVVARKKNKIVFTHFFRHYILPIHNGIWSFSASAANSSPDDVIILSSAGSITPSTTTIIGLKLRQSYNYNRSYLSVWSETNKNDWLIDWLVYDIFTASLNKHRTRKSPNVFFSVYGMMAWWNGVITEPQHSPDKKNKNVATPCDNTHAAVHPPTLRANAQPQIDKCETCIVFWRVLSFDVRDSTFAFSSWKLVHQLLFCSGTFRPI